MFATDSIIFSIFAHTEQISFLFFLFLINFASMNQKDVFWGYEEEREHNLILFETSLSLQVNCQESMSLHCRDKQISIGLFGRVNYGADWIRSPPWKGSSLNCFFSLVFWGVVPFFLNSVDCVGNCR